VSATAKRIIVFILLLAWCGALLALRRIRSHDGSFDFIPWNLFLAVIPAIAAMLFERSTNTAFRVIVFIVWLLFLPNAPYILTDFVHLAPRPNVPLWFDIALLGSAAATGLLLGYMSVVDVQTAIARSFGKAAGWFVAIAALLLTGFGIYLGRFLRWNSWDPLASPEQLFEEIARKTWNPVAHPRTIGVTFVYGVGITLGYVALRTIAATLPRDKWPRTH
jgi:uncharacterized membrane protein